MKKRILTAILTLAMLCAMLPAALAAGVTITTDKDNYMVGERMTITFGGTLPDDAWIFIYGEYAKIDQAAQTIWTYELDNRGIWTGEAPDKVGNYQIRVYGEYPLTMANPASALIAVKDIVVSYTGGSTPTPTTTPTPPTTPTTPMTPGSGTSTAGGISVTLDKPAYTLEEPMSITFGGTLPDSAWIFIYGEHAKIDQAAQTIQTYHLDERGLWTGTAPTEVGKYQVRVYGEYPLDLPNPASALIVAVDFTVAYNTTGKPAVATDKKNYAAGERMAITFSGLTEPQLTHAYIFIYGEHAKIDQAAQTIWTYHLDNRGIWTGEAPDEAGSYQVQVYGEYPLTMADPASALMATKDFTVAYNTTGKPGITLSKPSFAAEESMSITATGLSPVQIESGAVLMIYPQSGKLDQFAAYENVRDMDATNTWKVGAPRDAGIYEVRLYAQYPTYLTDLATGLLAQTTFTVGGAALPNQPVSGSVTPGQNGVSDWAIPEINNAIQEGLVTDKVTVDFSRPITREEFCELAVKLYEAISGNAAPAAPANTFTDTQNPEILKAFQLKIVNGTGQGLFSPGNPISRQEIATMLLRTVKAAVPALDTSAPNAPAFVDSGDIADWAREGVNYFASKEIIKGANGAFMPKANTTCEAAIALVKRTFDSFTAI